MIRRSSKIYIAGHEAIAGKALVRRLKDKGYRGILTPELDLMDQARVAKFFKKTGPEYVVLCAARSGGIEANIAHPAQFIHENIAIASNVIHLSYLNRVQRLVYLGSSCCYPKDAPQPMREEYLFTGELEETSRPYAMAKLAGIEMCRSYNREYGTRFLALIPATLYGPQEASGGEEAHVLSALLKKFSEAARSGKREVVVWGSGRPKREFLHADDAADAAIFFLNLKESMMDWKFPVVNIGRMEEISVKDLVMLVADETHFHGRIRWDRSKPDGVKRKLLSAYKMKSYGFCPGIKLRDGIREVLKPTL